MKSLHLIMPMGGKGSRFSQHGYAIPKPLILINGKPFFYWATLSIVKFIDVIDITFVVLQEHIDNFQIDKTILQFFPNAKIVVLPYVLDGAALTCLEGCKTIKDDEYVLFNDCDHMFKSTALNNFFHSKEPDDFCGGLVTFDASEPQFSFVKFDGNGSICGTVEKEVVSNRGICGAYLFKSSSLYQQMCQEYLQHCNYTEFFVSGIYNTICSHHGIIREFPLDFHVNYGTPEEYELAKNSSHFNIYEE